MTAKRFQYNVNKNCIEYDDKKFVAYVNSIDGFRIANKLNILLKENEQLKSSNMEYEDALARLEEKNEKLTNELKNLRRLSNELYMEGLE